MDKLSHGIHCGNFAADSLKLFFFLIDLFDRKRLREREREPALVSWFTQLLTVAKVRPGMKSGARKATIWMPLIF